MQKFSTIKGDIMQKIHLYTVNHHQSLTESTHAKADVKEWLR